MDAELGCQERNRLNKLRMGKKHKLRTYQGNYSGLKYFIRLTPGPENPGILCKSLSTSKAGSQWMEQGTLTFILKGEVSVRLISLSLLVRTRLFKKMFHAVMQLIPNQLGQGGEHYLHRSKGIPANASRYSFSLGLYIRYCD